MTIEIDLHHQTQNNQACLTSVLNPAMRVLMPVSWDLGLALKNSWARELGLLSKNLLGFWD